MAKDKELKAHKDEGKLVDLKADQKAVLATKYAGGHAKLKADIEAINKIDDVKPILRVLFERIFGA